MQTFQPRSLQWCGPSEFPMAPYPSGKGTYPWGLSPATPPNYGNRQRNSRGRDGGRTLPKLSRAKPRDHLTVSAGRWQSRSHPGLT